MRDPARILRVIAKLKQVWEMNPDMRLGQLYLNLMRDEVSGGTLRDIWNVEDDLLERRLNAYEAIERLSKGWRLVRDGAPTLEHRRGELNQQTPLEARLEEKIARAEQERTYRENWSTCLHDSMKYLGDIGSTRLAECQDCGLVTGVAR